MKKLKTFKSDYFKSEFVRNALTLITGTTIAQLIAILVMPVLSRIYTIEDFGVLSIYMSITAMLSVVSTMRYEMAVVLPEKEEDAVNIVALSFLISCFWSILSLVAIFMFGHLILDYFDNVQSAGFIYLIPLLVILMGLIQVLNFWSIRMKTFKNNALSRIGNAVGNNGVALTSGIAMKGPFGLLLGYFFAQFLMFLILSRQFISNFKRYYGMMNREGIIRNAKRYRNFPKINTLHAFVDSFQDNGVIFFMKDFFGNSVLGSYSFAFRLLKVPTGIISSAISQVFMEKASKAVHKGESVKPLLLRIYKIVFLIGAPFFIVLFIFSPDIFAFIFSENYREAGVIAQILTPWLFLNFIANSASGIPIIFNKLQIPFLFSCIDILLKIGSLFVGWYYHSYHIGFITMSISSSLLMIVSFIWVLSVVSNNKSNHYA